MNIKYLFILLSLFASTHFTKKSIFIPPSDQICGKWESSEKNLIIHVYKEDNKFISKILWFNANDGRPMSSWTDRNNPDETLRNRKIVGMSVLTDLIYKANTNSWENGVIYDAKHGRDWDASAYINNEGMLKVKGYWHFKFIGKTLTFKRL